MLWNKPFRRTNRIEVEWRRNMLIQEVIELGYSFIYTDVDVLWFRNPFPLLGRYDAMVMAPKHASDSQSITKSPGGGFFYMHSNEIALEFLKLWNFERILYPDSDTQSTLEMILQSSDEFLGFLRNKMSYLDTVDYEDFCQGSVDLRRVYIARVNCSTESEHKIHDVEILLDSWKSFTNKQHQSIKA
ncbi:uncharacterized protein At1g28695-like [Punica granatum]|uniref:Uncharacterized protein At1g28695-like n=1 Tax=Punica granatum TaxID=22663 RepID=A0A6P8CN61_PUNGR|nr:uncharacterized protein At1g28695-like [Punica granatum]